MTLKQLAKKINKKYGRKVLMTGAELAELKRKRDKYRPFNKELLLANGVTCIIDGVDTRDFTLKQLDKMRNYKELVVVQRGIVKTPTPNRKPHDKGINKETIYLQVGLTFGTPHNYKCLGIPLHRIVYCWFNGVVLPYNEKGEKMDICHRPDHDYKNNHINNLVWDTHKSNLAERTGATNQYGKPKHERT